MYKGKFQLPTRDFNTASLAMLIEDISTSAVPALASSLARLTVSGEQPPAAEELLLTVQTAEGGGSGLLLKISLRMHREQTALVYDERMCAHECPIGHPERPERIVELYRELNRLGFAEHCTPVPSRLVLREEVLLVHERRHWDRIEWAVGQEVTGRPSNLGPACLQVG